MHKKDTHTTCAFSPSLSLSLTHTHVFLCAHCLLSTSSIFKRVHIKKHTHTRTQKKMHTQAHICARTLFSLSPSNIYGCLCRSTEKLFVCDYASARDASEGRSRQSLKPTRSTCTMTGLIRQHGKRPKRRNKEELCGVVKSPVILGSQVCDCSCQIRDSTRP